MANNPAVEVRDLYKSYGELAAVSNVSFTIPERNIFGLLGPNGAGKTSIIEMIEGLRQPDRGDIRVCGLSPIDDGMRVRQIIGAQLQTTSLQDKMRVREAFDLFGRFYANPMGTEALLDLTGMRERAHTFFQYLSGGEKQRVALGLALVGNPQVLFLDEPTTGLDAQIRRELHELILRIRDQGKSILISTHYIEEAERLCDQVGFLSRGKLHAIGAPRDLIREYGEGERLEVSLRQPVELEVLSGLTGVDSAAQKDGTYVLGGRSAGKMLVALAIYVDRHANEVVDARMVHTSLEEVYLKMTGRRITE